MEFGLKKLTIIPRVRVAGIPVLDLATKQQDFRSIPNLFDAGETIDVMYVEGTTPLDEIRTEIFDAIVERLEAAKNDGIGMFQLIEDGSPPVIVEIGDIEEFVRATYGQFGGIEAEYYVAKVGDVNNLQGQNPNDVQYLKLDRIFLSAPPTIAYDRCEYFKPDKDNLLTFEWEGKRQEASCGFQYFYQTFSKNSKRKKFVKVGEKRERAVPDGTKFKESFKKIRWYCDNEPPQFEDWYLLFRDFIQKKRLNFTKLRPVDRGLDLDVLTKEIPEIKVVDLSPPEYSNFEKYNSMTIEDIVRLCMWMGLNLVVFDDFNDLMLCYSKDAEYHNNDKTQAGGVVVKIKDNHGYFVADGDATKLKFTSAGGHGFGGFYPSPKAEPSYGNEGYNDDGAAPDFQDCNIIKHPRATFKHKEEIYEWYGLPENPTAEDFKACQDEQLMPHLKKNPPPTADELVGLMGTPTIYYVGTSNLNGIVNYLEKYHNIKPTTLRGLPTAIHKATYNKLKLITYHQHPSIKYIPDDFDGDLEFGIDEEETKCLECIDAWKEEYPQLKSQPIPQPSAIAQAVFDKFNFDCYSRMNNKVRDIFFLAETKPDFRSYEPTHNYACAFSLDFSKAYSNSLKFMDCRWSVFDAIDEPEVFGKNQEFDEDAWYLCEELETGFPFKDLKDKGLALYHGCLARHLKEKLKPRFKIKSHKTLPPDTFKPFVEEAYETCGDGKNNIITAKTLVNQLIGCLKMKGGVKDYKLVVNSDVVQLTKHLAQGMPVVNLKQGKRWRGSSFITARANHQHHFLSGQPIRLQVIERINELNLLLDRAVRQSLNRDLHLVLVKTDALYYQYPDGAKWIYNKDYYWNDFKFNPFKEIDIDDVNSKLPDGYKVAIEHPCNQPCTSKKPVEIDERWTNAPSKSNQYPVPKFRRVWRSTKVYDYNWDKDEAKSMILYGWEKGGLLVKGEAGTGKTYIIKETDRMCNRNKIRLRWMRAFYKIVKGANYKEWVEAWREKNPCFHKKFAPTNKACNNIGGKTLHRGLGLRVCDTGEEVDDCGDEDEEGEKKDTGDRVARLIKLLEDNTPDIISVDEISMMGGDAWSLLSYIKYRLPKIRFYLYGDIQRQLAPVGEENRKFDNSICMKELTEYTQISLKYNHRRGGDSNKLWTEWSIHPNRFKVCDAPVRERNIAWTNKTRKAVIEKVQDAHPDPVMWLETLGDKSKRGVGQTDRLMLAYDTPLIARKSWKDRTIAKNEIWKVVEFEEEAIVLEFGDKREKFSKEEIIRFWLSAYCITIHKAQGDTYDDDYTIWDWERLSADRSYNGRRMRYVAQSRSTKPEDLITYK